MKMQNADVNINLEICSLHNFHCINVVAVIYFHRLTKRRLKSFYD